MTNLPEPNQLARAQDIIADLLQNGNRKQRRGMLATIRRRKKRLKKAIIRRAKRVNSGHYIMTHEGKLEHFSTWL